MSMTENERDLCEDIPDCMFCGQHKADALWLGNVEIFICRWCAVKDVLPKLMADAVCNARLEWKGRNLQKDVEDSLKDIKASYYRAAMINTNRILENESNSRVNTDVINKGCME